MSNQEGHKLRQSNSTVQHGNLARIDPKINVVNEYQFYIAIQQNGKKENHHPHRKVGCRETDQTGELFKT